jgi:hypothetical protein
MTNLTLTIHFCDISQSFVSATKYENTSTFENSSYTQHEKRDFPKSSNSREYLLLTREYVL